MQFSEKPFQNHSPIVDLKKKSFNLFQSFSDPTKKKLHQKLA
jgi:hypothetical protein